MCISNNRGRVAFYVHEALSVVLISSFPSVQLRTILMIQEVWVVCSENDAKWNDWLGTKSTNCNVVLVGIWL